MNENLRTKTEEWMQLERKTLEQRRIAENYYDENLMDLITEDYVRRCEDSVLDEVKYLVVSVGTSYEPIVLNIKLFHPEKILFLYTAKSESVLQKIVSYCDLKVDQYEKERICETDPLDIYQEIKEIYLKWERPEKMYIDFTGGTKAMSAACAMAGAMVNVQLIYVGTNEYLTDFRKPNPGSETLFYIDNPLAVFGDLEIEKAFTLFTEYNFSGAKDKLDELKETIPEPEIRQQLKFVHLLASAYEAWDSLDFVPAYENLNMLNMQLKRDQKHRHFLMMDFSTRLRRQEQMLANLKQIPDLIAQKKNMDILRNKDIIVSLMFTMYQNAMTREKQGKLDMATLLLYRLLEMIEQRRLCHYNLYASSMDYTKMKVSDKKLAKYKDTSPADKLRILKADVTDIRTGLFRKPGNTYLSDQVSLLEGYIILYALQDSIVYQGENDRMAMLQRIRSMVYLRNNSIFAHGLGPVKQSDFIKFRDFVTEVFGRFCKIEKINMDDYMEMIHWFSPMESENYSHMGNN